MKVYGTCTVKCKARPECPSNGEININAKEYLAAPLDFKVICPSGIMIRIKGPKREITINE